MNKIMFISGIGGIVAIIGLLVALAGMVETDK